MFIDKAMSKIYTDGSCLGNPGPGGWGIVVVCDDNIILKQGGSMKTSTNNIMELSAMEKALEYARLTDGTYDVYTDSNYVKLGITQWVTGWKKKNWKTSSGQPVKNIELWKSIDEKFQMVKERVVIHWIKAHAGHKYNELVDTIARTYAEECRSKD